MLKRLSRLKGFCLRFAQKIKELDGMQLVSQITFTFASS